MFGEKLRELRKNKNLSMDKLIELYNEKYEAKMNKSTLSRYENNLQDPIYTVVVNLAKLFDVSVDCMIDNCSTENFDEIKNLYKMLDEIDRAELKGEIRQMLKADKYKKIPPRADTLEDI